MTMYRFFVGFLSLQLTLLVTAYPYFQGNIPNGNKVPHPCKPNTVWEGVGHINHRGGGARNDFGKAFYNSGKQWTPEFCGADTDGDGKTNGEELGDPNCVWKAGDPHPNATVITHPGVCDPWESKSCEEQNKWIDCDPENDFRCDALNEVGMKNKTVRFPKTRVPPTETNYYCMAFELPIDGDYHLAATVPHIDNRDLMHHILLFGCDESQGSVEMPLNQPQPCGMGDSKCNRLMSLWAIGYGGHCFHNTVGIRIGSNGKAFKKAMFQFHYNNPQLRNDYYDSSGMVLYYTPNLRPNDASILMIGQLSMEILPRQERVEVTGHCSSDCTRAQFSGNVSVTEAANHMHYMGRAMKIEQYRNGVKIRTITDDPVYSYEDPVSYSFQEPFEIFRGDDLKVTCIYSSSNKVRTTFYGDGTSDEMCYGFLTYYPADNIKNPFCYSWKSIPTCKLWDPESFPVIDGCEILEAYNPLSNYSKNMSDEVMKSCVPFGPCYPECLAELRRLKDHPCLKGDIDKYFRSGMKDSKNPNILKFYAAFDSCVAERDAKPCVCETCPPTGTSAAQHSVISIRVILLTLMLIFCNGYCK